MEVGRVGGVDREGGKCVDGGRRGRLLGRKGGDLEVVSGVVI